MKTDAKISGKHTQSILFARVPKKENLDSKQFIAEYKNKSLPLVLTGITEHWPAKKKWTIGYLKQVMADVIVPVYSSQPAKGRDHQNAAAQHIAMDKYLTKLENGESDLRLFFYNILSECQQLKEDFEFPKYGLRFFKRLPVLFVGGRNARVQMHYDVDLSDLFLCHFGGKKRVYLFAPDQGKYLYQVPFSFSSLYDVDVLNPDFEKYPALKKVRGYMAELNHGDTLYIPSGYWHYIIYDDIGFSLTLRAFPTSVLKLAKVAFSLVVVRTVEGLMRASLGQRWNEFNERRALLKTNRRVEQGSC